MDPELGRWLSLDPELGKLSQPQSMNRYVYCVNNPLRFTDPTGRFWNIIGGAIAGALFNAAVYLVWDVAIKGESFDAWKLVEEMAVGAVTGAIAGATFGLSAVGSAAGKIATKIGGTVGKYAGTAFAGAIAGSVSGVAGYAITTNPAKWTVGGFLASAGLGAAIGAAGATGGKFIKSLLPKNWGLGTGNPWDVRWNTKLSLEEFGNAIVSALPSKIVNKFLQEAYQESSSSVASGSFGASSSQWGSLVSLPTYL
jgi:hypothetical protein